jgi:hypothetical protein
MPRINPISALNSLTVCSSSGISISPRVPRGPGTRASPVSITQNRVPRVKHQELKSSVRCVLNHQFRLAFGKRRTPERLEQTSTVEVLADFVRPPVASSHEIDHDGRISQRLGFERVVSAPLPHSMPEQKSIRTAQTGQSSDHDQRTSIRSLRPARSHAPQVDPFVAPPVRAVLLPGLRRRPQFVRNDPQVRNDGRDPLGRRIQPRHAPALSVLRTEHRPRDARERHGDQRHRDGETVGFPVDTQTSEVSGSLP